VRCFDWPVWLAQNGLIVHKRLSSIESYFSAAMIMRDRTKRHATHLVVSRGNQPRKTYLSKCLISSYNCGAHFLRGFFLRSGISRPTSICTNLKYSKTFLAALTVYLVLSSSKEGRDLVFPELSEHPKRKDQNSETSSLIDARVEWSDVVATIPMHAGPELNLINSEKII